MYVDNVDNVWSLPPESCYESVVLEKRLGCKEINCYESERENAY